MQNNKQSLVAEQRLIHLFEGAKDMFGGLLEQGKESQGSGGILNSFRNTIGNLTGSQRSVVENKVAGSFAPNAAENRASGSFAPTAQEVFGLQNNVERSSEQMNIQSIAQFFVSILRELFQKDQRAFQQNQAQQEFNPAQPSFTYDFAKGPGFQLPKRPKSGMTNRQIDQHISKLENAKKLLQNDLRKIRREMSVESMYRQQDAMRNNWNYGSAGFHRGFAAYGGGNSTWANMFGRNQGRPQIRNIERDMVVNDIFDAGDKATEQIAKIDAEIGKLKAMKAKNNGQAAPQQASTNDRTPNNSALRSAFNQNEQRFQNRPGFSGTSPLASSGVFPLT